MTRRKQVARLLFSLVACRSLFPASNMKCDLCSKHSRSTLKCCYLCQVLAQQLLWFSRSCLVALRCSFLLSLRVTTPEGSPILPRPIMRKRATLERILNAALPGRSLCRRFPKPLFRVVFHCRDALQFETSHAACTCNTTQRTTRRISFHLSHSIDNSVIYFSKGAFLTFGVLWLVSESCGRRDTPSVLCFSVYSYDRTRQIKLQETSSRSRPQVHSRLAVGFSVSS